MGRKCKHGVEGSCWPGVADSCWGWEVATCICLPRTQAACQVKRRRDKAFGGTVIYAAWKNVGRFHKAVASKEHIFKLKRS